MQINSITSPSVDAHSKFFTYKPPEEIVDYRTAYHGFRGFTRKVSNRRSQDEKAYSSNVNLIFGSLKKDTNPINPLSTHKSMKAKISAKEQA